MKSLLLVTKETYLRQVKSWSFILMVISPFIFVLFSGGIGYFTSSSAAKNDSNEIAIVTEAPLDHQLFKTIDHVTFDYNSVTKAKKALKSDKVAGYLLVTVDNDQIKAYYHSKDAMDKVQKGQVTQSLVILQEQLNIHKAGLSANQLAILSTKPELKETLNKHDGYAKIGKMIAFFALVIILYFILLIYSTSTAQEIAGEKGAKIMEVIFSSIPAPIYFYGRILGILGVIITHIGIYVVGGYGCYTIMKHLSQTKGLIAKVQPLIDSVFKYLNVSMLLFVILGLLLYVVLSALCGSLVVRSENASKASAPIMYIVMIGFFGSFILGQQNQDSLLLKIGSYIPCLSSFFMPIRMINGYAGLFESVISLVILALVTIFVVIYIGKSYAGFILQTDDIGFFKSLKRGFFHR